MPDRDTILLIYAYYFRGKVFLVNILKCFTIFAVFLNTQKVKSKIEIWQMSKRQQPNQEQIKTGVHKWVFNTANGGHQLALNNNVYYFSEHGRQT